MQHWLQHFFTTYTPHLIKVCFIAIGVIIGLIIVDYAFKSWLSHAPTKRAKTILSVLQRVINAGIIVIAILIGLSIFHININPLLASAGIVGLAIGFGSQVLVKDIISGVFFILENQFNEGDVIRVDTVEGMVENIGLRTISLRETDTGALHIIPNGSIGRIANLTDRYASVNVDIMVPVKNDVDTVKQLLDDVAEAITKEASTKDHVYEPIMVHTLQDLTDAKMTFRVIIKTHPGKQEPVARHYRYLVKKAFDKAKIILAWAMDTSSIRCLPAFFEHLPVLARFRAFTLGTRIYLPKSVYLDLATDNPSVDTLSRIAHEETHVARIKEIGILVFGLRYLFFADFRYHEELTAVTAGWRYLKQHDIPVDITAKAKALSGIYYLWAVPYEKAKNDLTAIWESLWK